MKSFRICASVDIQHFKKNNMYEVCGSTQFFFLVLYYLQIYHVHLQLYLTLVDLIVLFNRFVYWQSPFIPHMQWILGNSLFSKVQCFCITWCSLLQSFMCDLLTTSSSLNFADSETEWSKTWRVWIIGGPVHTTEELPNETCHAYPHPGPHWVL